MRPLVRWIRVSVVGYIVVALLGGAVFATLIGSAIFCDPPPRLLVRPATAQELQKLVIGYPPELVKCSAWKIPCRRPCDLGFYENGVLFVHCGNYDRFDLIEVARHGAAARESGVGVRFGPAWSYGSFERPSKCRGRAELAFQTTHYALYVEDGATQDFWDVYDSIIW